MKLIFSLLNILYISIFVVFQTASIAYQQNPTLWVQVPQWENDWSKCAVDIPDASCHWYVASPDNTFGEGFSWYNSPWFDVNGLNDIPTTSQRTILQKLQSTE